MATEGQILYEEWFLDISRMFTIHLPVIKFDEEANVYYVNSTVSGSRYLKEIIGKIKLSFKSEALVLEKLYEEIFERMKRHFKTSSNRISRDEIFVNCLDCFLEQMFRELGLQETYSILLGNVLTPSPDERMNIIRNLKNLGLTKHLQILEVYWDVLPKYNKKQRKIKINEDLEIAIELIKHLESHGKVQVLQKIISANNHPYMDLYHTDSGHYQMIRLGKKGMIEVSNAEYHQYQRYRDKLDLYIIENLMSNPKIIHIENVNEKIKQGKLEYDQRTEKINYQKYKKYRIY